LFTQKGAAGLKKGAIARERVLGKPTKSAIAPKSAAHRPRKYG